MVIALVQLINLLAETELAQLNTHKDKSPPQAVHTGLGVWDVG